MKIVDIMMADKDPNWKLVHLALATAKRKTTVENLSYVLNMPAREIVRLINEPI